MNQTNTSATSSTVSAEAISNRAYELWEKEGRLDGKDQHYWFQAEQELRGASNRSDEFTAKTPARNSDVAPLKGTRAGAAAENAASRGNAAPSPAPSTGGASSSAKPAGKRASANPFPGKKPTSAL